MALQGHVPGTQCTEGTVTVGIKADRTKGVPEALSQSGSSGTIITTKADLTLQPFSPRPKVPSSSGQGSLKLPAAEMVGS